jgi:hypothetical protein
VKNWKSFRPKFSFFCLSLLVLLSFSFSLAPAVRAQAIPYARTFSKSKEDVEAALKEFQAYAGQKLPIVDGFVAMGQQPLDRYERAFYQFSVELIPETPQSTVVKLTAKITAWYADPDPAKSGYQALPSNGRLELDLLDRLSEKLGGKLSVHVPRTNLQAPRPKIDSSGNYLPQISPAAGGASSPYGAAPTEPASPAPAPSETAALKVQRENEQKHMLQLKSDLEALQEIRHNQAHPRNLVIVKKSGSAVLARPAETSKILFTASADDEFEFIDAEGEWFHIQIAGASRGYIRRSQVESMDPRWNTAAEPAKAEATSAPLFRVTREESGPFPGTWAPLKNMTVKIFWVQPVDSPATSTTPDEKREFTKSLFQRAWNDSKQSQNSNAGAVVVFDTPDGGQVSTTMVLLQSWMENKTAEPLFWRQCSVDPPELFGVPSKH